MRHLLGRNQNVDLGAENVVCDVLAHFNALRTCSVGYTKDKVTTDLHKESKDLPA